MLQMLQGEGWDEFDHVDFGPAEKIEVRYDFQHSSYEITHFYPQDYCPVTCVSSIEDVFTVLYNRAVDLPHEYSEYEEEIGLDLEV